MNKICLTPKMHKQCVINAKSVAVIISTYPDDRHEGLSVRKPSLRPSYQYKVESAHLWVYLLTWVVMIAVLSRVLLSRGISWRRSSS